MNKGFTLVELIGVITIIGLLAVLTAPAYNEISSNIKTRNYNSKKETIKKSTLSYVERYFKNDAKNEIIYTVNYLIKNGIISSDSEKEEYIENNISGEKYSGEKEYIKITYDSDNLKLIAHICKKYNNTGCSEWED